jgi:hypothetical protein
MAYAAAEDRYNRVPYRRCGTSGLMLPASSKSRRAARDANALNAQVAFPMGSVS